MVSQDKGSITWQWCPKIKVLLPDNGVPRYRFYYLIMMSQDTSVARWTINFSKLVSQHVISPNLMQTWEKNCWDHFIQSKYILCLSVCLFVCLYPENVKTADKKVYIRSQKNLFTQECTAVSDKNKNNLPGPHFFSVNAVHFLIVTKVLGVSLEWFSEWLEKIWGIIQNKKK